MEADLRQTILSLHAEPCVLVDSDLCITAVNKVFCRHFNCDYHENTGRLLISLPDFAALNLEPDLKLAFKQPHYFLNARQIRNDEAGYTATYDIYTHLIPFENLELMLMFREMVPFPEKLPGTRDMLDTFGYPPQILYEALFENTHDAVFIINLDGYYVGSNRRAAEIFGYRQDEMVGLHAFDRVEPDELPDSRARHKEILDGRQIPIYERTFRDKYGKKIVAELSVSLVRDEQGNPLYIQSIMRDITTRKANDRALHEQLSLRAERDKVAMMEQMIQDVSHDLKTPVSTLGTSTYLLEKLTDKLMRQLMEMLSHVPDKSGELQQYFEQITQTILSIRMRSDNLAKNSNRLQKLIETIFELAQIEMRANFNFEYHDINAIAENLYNMLQPVAEEKGLDMRFLPCAGLPLLHVDEYELARAINKLIDNAIQFNRHSGSVSIRVRYEQDTVMIDVIDSGIGIAEHELHLVSDRFYRADKARQLETGGLGIGLTIAEKIVKAHKGRIDVLSTLGEGSCFTIVLPVGT